MKTQGFRAGLFSISALCMRSRRGTIERVWLPLKTVLIAVLAASLLTGCGPETTNSSPVARPTDPLDEAAYLSNGLIGLRFDKFSTGRFADSEAGRKSAMFLIENYDHRGEEKIYAYPNPLTPELVHAGSSCFNNASRLRQSLDMERGLLLASWRWGNSLIETKTLIPPNKIACYQAWRVQIESDGEYEASFGSTRRPTRFKRRVQVSLNGKTLFGDESVKFTTRVGTIVEITYWIGEGTDIDQDLREHRRFWTDFWSTRIEIDGPPEDQRAIDSFLFYLRTSTPSNWPGPIGPYGLSSPTYNGHTFWDADMWLFPALAFLDPQRAKSIPDYRISRASVAERNFKERLSWFRNPPSQTDVDGVEALQYPWEASIGGQEVSPTETKQQHHITGSVVWGLKMASDLGLANSETVRQIGAKAAKFYKFRSVIQSTAEIQGSANAASSPKYRTILQTVSPDEHHFGDHDLYTNAVADWVIQEFGSKEQKLPRFYLPHDGESFLNYFGDPLKGYKQTSGLLAAFPLQNQEVEKESTSMLDRFADKVSKNGPAMSDAIHATLWARAGQTDRAYQAWKASWRDFVREPFMLFSEKRSRTSAYFTTGAAGALNTVLYGFLGIRIDDRPLSNAQYTTRLNNGRWLSIAPHLPKEWTGLRVRGLTILGRRYEVTVSGNQVNIFEEPNRSGPP